MSGRERRVWRALSGRLLRAALVGLVLAGAAAAFGAARNASAKSEMLEMGADMLRVPESAAGKGRMLMNGAELQIGRGTTPRPVGELLAEQATSCPSPLRGGDEERGFVSCGADESGALPIAYTYAERRGDTTHYVSLQGGQGVDVRAMFPSDQDVPGSDPEGLVRPPSSRRLLSLRVPNEPYHVVVYIDGERKLDDLVAHYQRTSPGGGWTVVAGWRVDEGPGPRQASVVIERAGVLGLLVVAQDRPDATTTTFLTMEANREQ